MKTKFSKTLSIILAMLMLVSGLEVTGFASNLTNNTEVSFDNIENEKPNIESEIISKRTAYSKVFSTDDGGYYSVVSATPIHIRDENGDFQNIDEPTVELLTEEDVTDYIAQVSDTYNNLSQMSTYSAGVGENDILGEDEISLSISCWDNKAKKVVTTGYYVQGTAAGNKTIIIQPSYDNWDVKANVIITDAKLFANGKGVASTSNNLVVAKKVNQWEPGTNLDENGNLIPAVLQLNNYYFDASYIAKPSNSMMSYECEWDITNVLNEWLLDSKNNGFALSSINTKTRCNVEFTNFQIGYYYREINNIDDMSSYETIDMGVAGTFYIDHFTRNIFMERTDIGIDGEKAPVSIKQTYNSLYCDDQSTVGMNFHLNYYSYLTYSDSIYTFHTPQGDTLKLFKRSENSTSITYTDNGEKYTLTLNADATNSEFLYTKFENLTISTIEGEIYHFESHQSIGYLCKIVDSSTNANEIIINYYLENEQGDLYKTEWIQSIIDGSGRIYSFDYVSHLGKLYISSIVAQNEYYEPITVGTGEDAETYMVEYEYIFSGDKVFLSQINYVGTDDNIHYFYDLQDRLYQVKYQDKTLTFTYEPSSLYSVSDYTITTNQIISSDGKEFCLEAVKIECPSVYQRILTNENDEQKTINFDRAYNMTYYKDFDGSVIFGTTKSQNEYYISCEGVDNLIKNNTFSENDETAPENWSCDYAEIDLTKTSFLGILGDLSNDCYVYQMVTLPDGETFKAGDSYAYGGKAEAANALVANNTHTFGIYIFDATSDENGELIPNQCIAYFNFDEIIARTGQERMSYFTLSNDTDALFVYLRNGYNCDAHYAYFSNIKLFEYSPEIISLPTDPYNYDYNDNNSLVSIKRHSQVDSNKYMGSSYYYDNSCDSNYLSAIEDENGITTYYTYNPDNGRLVSVATGTEDNAKTFEYTASGLLSSVEQTVTNAITGNTVEMKTDYGYTDDGMLSSVSHNGLSYNFTYDVFGNITDISVNTIETPLVSTTYTENNIKQGQVDIIEYANGDSIEYHYNTASPSLITQIDFKQHNVDGKENYSKSIRYEYDANGNLTSMIDDHANVRIDYGNHSYTYTTTDNSVTIYTSTTDGVTGNTVETFQQFEAQINNTISPSIQTENDIYEKTSSSSQTLNKVVPQYNDYGDPWYVDGVLQTRTSETYTYEKDITYDEFMRPMSNSILAHYKTDSKNVIINSEEKYTYHSENGKETTLIDTYRTIRSSGSLNSSNEIVRDANGDVVDEAFIDLTYSYQYDEAGNIIKIMLTDNLTQSETVYSIFQYDGANQLTFEYSVSKDSCIYYTYDAGGNITEKRIYNLSAFDFSNNSISTSASYDSYVFTYDSTYKDRLISVSINGSNGTTIEYDNLGNPLNYDVADGTFEWNGRLLTAFETNGEGNRYEYEYDANGLRIRKILYDKDLVSGSSSEYTYTQTGTIEYVWMDGILKGVSITNTVQNTNFFMNIIYDEKGIAQGYVGITGTPYYFVRDPLGNITSIVGATNDVTVEVKYDAWGNPTFPTVSDDILVGIVTAFVCYLNPSTYKGYLYDYETGLYYCQSRYYSPVWSRFINIDDTRILQLTKGETLGCNLYAYCNNNPVNFTDETGYLGQHWYNKVSNVAKIIDVVILAISAGKSIVGLKTMRAFLKTNQRKIVKNVTVELTKALEPVSSIIVSAAVEAALILVDTSLGGLLAKALDYVDPLWKRGYVRNNQYIFN